MMLDKLAQLAAPLRMSLLRLSGPARFSDAELTATYVGNGRNLDFLSHLFFREITTDTLAADLTPLQMRAALRQRSRDAELTLSELPPMWALLLPREGTIRFPAWVRQEIVLPAGTAGTERWLLPRAIERETARIVRRHGYVIDFTTANDAMEVFFRNLYRPYVQARFGTESHVDEEKTFMDRCRGQTLARLHAGDDWVAGLLLRQRGESLRLGRFGASSNPPSPGASEVLDTLVIRHGYAHGVRRIVMGDTRPCLSDGVLRYKARFGAAIRPTLFPQPTLCISVRGWSDAVTAALAEQPLIAFRRRKPHVWRVSGAGSDSRIYIEPLGVGTTDGR